MMREQIEPLLRKRLNSLPKKIQLRSPMRFKTLAPSRAPRIFKVETEIEPVPSGVIRELAVNAIRDAQSALRQLAADRVVS